MPSNSQRRSFFIKSSLFLIVKQILGKNLATDLCATLKNRFVPVGQDEHMNDKKNQATI